MDKKILPDNLLSMGRFSNRTIPVTAEQMRRYSAAIKQMAAVHDCLATLMTDNSLGPVEMRNYQSASDALENFARYMGAATEAISDAIAAKGNDFLEAGRDASTADYAARQAVKALLDLRNKHIGKYVEAWEQAEVQGIAGGIVEERKTVHKKGAKRRKPATNNT